MKRTPWLLSCVLALAAGQAPAQVKSYMQIPGVPGESVSDKHQNWIDILTVSVSVADRACQGVSVTKNLDKSSPLVSGTALTGGVYSTVTIDVERSTTDKPEVFLTYLLENVTVAAVQISTAASIPTFESVHLVPTSIKMTYKPTSAGAPPPEVSFTLTCPRK